MIVKVKACCVCINEIIIIIILQKSAYIFDNSHEVKLAASHKPPNCGLHSGINVHSCVKKKSEIANKAYVLKSAIVSECTALT